ncbi:hypothetical protein Ahy_B06g084133 [Arachis hypogaea]|uniref:MULE transposase domain-containing protein n=1 Tax=Arachis hypogaea TaxID=3818 RepID=A0A444YR83_ARAHY|nr:hypothetical protein Ahy_B06g084133 [Arachis hypogaea]
MKGKTPGCVITDGHEAMRKAIEAVFFGAYHHFCVWHLLMNATSNLSNPTFTSEFKKCMLFNYEVTEFEDHWHYMVDALGLSDNQSVFDFYSRRNMWATAHIHGHFLGVFVQRLDAKGCTQCLRSAANKLTREIFLLFRPMLF